MKFFGHANLQNNQIQAAVMQSETNFPINPTVGRIIFKDKRVYICAMISGDLPVWVPLTNEINTYVHAQTVASATWSVNHDLNTSQPLVQVFGIDNKMFIPDEITVVDNNNVTVTLSSAQSGRAVVMYGDVTGAAKPQYAYEFLQTAPLDTWVVDHNLGYNPIVRVFINKEEVQPLSIVHDTVNRTTITFSSAYTGYAVFL